MQETTAATPLLSAASKLASVEVKKVLRRVHVPQSKRDKKEALKPFGRMLGKIAAANPLSVAQTMIAQVHRHLRTLRGLQLGQPAGILAGGCNACDDIWVDAMLLRGGNETSHLI